MASTRTSKTAGEINTDDGTPSGDTTPVIAVNGVEPDTTAPEATPEAPAEEAPKMSELTGIRYVGMADTKSYTSANLEAMGVENPKGDLEWNSDNDRFVQASEFNAATRDVLLSDPNFLAV